MHDRLSVSGLCFPGRSATEVLDAVAAIGARRTTLQLGVVSQAGEAAVRRHSQSSGVAVEALIGGSGPVLNDRSTWPAARERLVRAVNLATGIGATSIYLLTGSRRAAPWEAAVEQFATFMGPCLEQAASAGVALAVEPANVLFADLTFVHSAATAFALAREVRGLRVCLDIFHTWTEFDLRRSIMAGASLISLVQVSDYVLGDRSLPARAVPGDGGVPIADIVAWLGEAGYQGIVDLELNGPRIDAEGHLAAARRGGEALNRVLEGGLPT
jgi:sugar phosphate isomerase/epimerase